MTMRFAGVEPPRSARAAGAAPRTSDGEPREDADTNGQGWRALQDDQRAGRAREEADLNGRVRRGGEVREEGDLNGRVRQGGEVREEGDRMGGHDGAERCTRRES